MKFKIHRDIEPVDIDILTIYIGDERFRLSESKDGKLNIIKYSDGQSDLIKIHPRTGNEIELS
jgi:hypothetical protein